MTMSMPNDGLKGLAPVEPQKLAGIMPNAQHQNFHRFMTGAPYELAIVEFDDQGRCYDGARWMPWPLGSTRWRPRRHQGGRT